MKTASPSPASASALPAAQGQASTCSIPQLIAHRGVHQNFSREGLTNDTCTAERIFPPDKNKDRQVLTGTSAELAAAVGDLLKQKKFI